MIEAGPLSMRGSGSVTACRPSDAAEDAAEHGRVRPRAAAGFPLPRGRGWSLWRGPWLAVGSSSSVGIPSVQGPILRHVGREHPSPQARGGLHGPAAEPLTSLDGPRLRARTPVPTHTGLMGLACSWHRVPGRSLLQHPLRLTLSPVLSPGVCFLILRT